MFDGWNRRKSRKLTENKHGSAKTYIGTKLFSFFNVKNLIIITWNSKHLLFVWWRLFCIKTVWNIMYDSYSMSNYLWLISEFDKLCSRLYAFLITQKIATAVITRSFFNNILIEHLVNIFQDFLHFGHTEFSLRYVLHELEIMNFIWALR